MQQLHRGFSLIELLVVIAIIAIISTIGFASYSSATVRARDGKRKADLNQVRAALELYRSSNTGYPVNGSYTAMTNVLRTGGFLSDPLPVDPKNTGSLVYVYSGTAPSYCLCGQLELTGTGNSANANCSGSSGNYYCLTNP